MTVVTVSESRIRPSACSARHLAWTRWSGVTSSASAVLIVALVFVMVGCAGGGTSTVPTVVTTAAATTTAPPSTVGSGAPAGDADLQVEVVATGLDVPWEMRFLPDGNLVVTERTGRIVRVDPTTGAVTPLGGLPVAANGESGLLGLAVDPDFPAQPYLYVAYTHDAGAGGLQNRVSRLTLRGDAIGEEKMLVDGIPAGSIHDGSRVAFGPDGFLWVTTGDAGQGSPAQDRSFARRQGAAHGPRRAPRVRKSLRGFLGLLLRASQPPGHRVAARGPAAVPHRARTRHERRDQPRAGGWQLRLADFRRQGRQSPASSTPSTRGLRPSLRPEPSSTRRMRSRAGAVLCCSSRSRNRISAV